MNPVGTAGAGGGAGPVRAAATPAVPAPVPVPASPRRALATAGLVLAATAYVAAVDPARPGRYPPCLYVLVTGHWCPGCGGLRAVHALTHGDVVAALGHNPIVVLAVPLAVVVWAVWLRRALAARPMRPSVPTWVAWVSGVVLIAFWVARNLPGMTWLAP